MAKSKFQTIDVTTLSKDITITSKSSYTGIYFKNLNNFDDLTFEGATKTHSNTNDLTITVNGHKIILKAYFAQNGKFPVKTIKTDLSQYASVNIINYVNDNYIKGVKQNIVNGLTKTINGTVFDDIISPLGKNQTINAGKGNDLIFADTGNDTMIGGLGTNEFRFEYVSDPDPDFNPQKNFGKDTIKLTKGETLNLNIKYENSTPVNLTFSKGTGSGANDLIITNDANPNDKITIKNYYGKETGATVYINGKNLVEETADFLSLDEDNVVKSKITGSALADVIDATDVEQQYKTVKKKGKKVKVETNLIINSGAGDDDITGSNFNDTITSGKGENTIRYNVDQAFGHDIINLTKGETIHLSFARENGSELDPYALRYSHGTGKKGKNDLIITIEGDNNNSVTIKNYYGKTTGATVLINGCDMTTYFYEFRTPENTVFNDVNITDSKTKSYTGSALADKIDASGMTAPTKVKKGVQYGITINSGAGNDEVTGSDYNDTISGGAGMDVLSGGKGNDTIKAGIGTGDEIIGGIGNDNLYASMTKGSTTKFIFRAGDGKDTVYSGKGADTLDFGDNSDLKFEKKKRDLIIKYNNEQDSVTIKNYYNSKGKIKSSVKYVEFLGKIYDIETLRNYMSNPDYDFNIINNDYAPEGEKNQVIVANNAASENVINIVTQAGNDIIYGADRGTTNINAGAGNDIIFGGAGNSTIMGESGDDTYNIESLYAKTVIYDRDNVGVVNIDTNKSSINVFYDMQVTVSGGIVTACDYNSLRLYTTDGGLLNGISIMANPNPAGATDGTPAQSITSVSDNNSHTLEDIDGLAYATANWIAANKADGVYSTAELVQGADSTAILGIATGDTIVNNVKTNYWS